jgi:CBS domain-containing protein
MTMNAKDVLRLKGSDVLIIEPHRSILTAMQILVESDRGALLVVDGRDRIQGILTERDISAQYPN